jgi:cytoskeletal protein CcmA (bactofilin family)
MFRTDPTGERLKSETASEETSQPSLYKGSTYAQTPTHTSTTTPAVSESEALARDIKDEVLKGFFSKGATITGEITFSGTLRVDGRLSGLIISEDGTLIVSTGGQVDADIEVAAAVIRGTVNGDITAARQLEIHRSARVTGDIQTPTLLIEQGAVFEGSCRMSGQESSKRAARKKLREYAQKQAAGG